jgi:ribosomal protein L11 methylase PrmA
MPAAATAEAPGRIPGSFRDPSGYVFFHRNRVFRTVDAECRDTLQGLITAGVLPRLMSSGAVVRTRFVDESGLLKELEREHGRHAAFLEHERLTHITYPYEWSLSMVADAGRHTLDLQIALLESGCSLKDATAYNVQFVGGAPKFIDLPSFERAATLNIWYALGQFQRMFVYPLLLGRYLGWDPRSYFLPNLDGRSASQVARAFKGLQAYRPGILLDVTLPSLLERRSAGAGTAGKSAAAGRGPGSAAAQIPNLKRLSNKLRSLADGYKPSEAWVDYTRVCSYDDTAEAAKKTQVATFLQRIDASSVLDLGANTGDYSYVAAQCGADVVAVDQSHDTIEVLYRRLRKEPARITPAVVDLRSPSPGIGYRNMERPPFFDRVSADCVMALALIHHLIVSGNMTMAAVRELFAGIVKRHLILEFVPPDDEMFQRLTRFRRDEFGHLTLEQCIETFSSCFQLEAQAALPHSGRTLLLFRRKES